jgi:CobQ-like glutamine amidotransferase family enzyme
MPLKHVHGPCKSLRNPKTVGKLMKTALKCKNYEFLVMPLKHVHGPCKSLRNPKTVGKLMKTALKCKNYEFLVMPLKYVLSVMDLVNHS